jgi:xanthine dehydrogenase iron-sulfur cluster and FAD-binding subunit A
MTNATLDQASAAVAQQAATISAMRAESEVRLAAYNDRLWKRRQDELRHRWERA